MNEKNNAFPPKNHSIFIKGGGGMVAKLFRSFDNKSVGEFIKREVSQALSTDILARIGPVIIYSLHRI